MFSSDTVLSNINAVKVILNKNFEFAQASSCSIVTTLI